MAWKIKIAASALQDINNIKRWYKSQSDQALENFSDELFNSIESLKDDTVDFKAVYKDNRKLPLKKFPYFVVYRRIEADHSVIINAVFHKQRDDNALNRRLSEDE
jgi:plasmid stabilization system protein ParE